MLITTGQFAYANSKAALKQQSFHLGQHLKGTGIRVNQIAPGVFPSESTSDILRKGAESLKLTFAVTTSKSDDAQKSEYESKLGNPAGRPGSDAEMAATILYLAGPGGLFCNGEVIHPDGGNLLVAPSAM